MGKSNKFSCGGKIDTAMSPVSLTKFWRERIVALVVGQLMQGVTPQKIALSIALGLSLGVFPILGTTTTLCAIAAIRLKLNQPIIQLVNWLCIMRAPLVSLSIPELIHKFHVSPMKFFREFAMTGLHGIVAWLFIAPLLTAATYCVLVPALKKLAALKTSIVNSRNAA
jgi:hypothetical protein